MANEVIKEGSTKAPTKAEIFNEFQALRNEQRNLANNLGTLEMDLKEHNTVIDTLKTVDESRKCFRLIGGVLCERNVKEVLPQLIDGKEQLENYIKVLTEQLTKKGQEINKYKLEHNVKLAGQHDPIAADADDKSDDKQGNRNVLVVDN